MPSFSPHTLPLYRALVLFSATVSVHSHTPTLTHLLPSSFQPHCSIVSSFSAYWTDILVLFAPRFFSSACLFLSPYLRWGSAALQHSCRCQQSRCCFRFLCMYGQHWRPQRYSMCLCCCQSWIHSHSYYSHASLPSWSNVFLFFPCVLHHLQLVPNYCTSHQPLHQLFCSVL